MRKKKLIPKGRKSHTDVKKKSETNLEIKKNVLRKSNTFNSKTCNIFINVRQTIKEEDDDKKYETILKKSKSLIFEKINTYKKFKAVLETIHEVSNSKVDSSELSDLKEEIHKDEANNNG